jgi:hypothetical protein
VESWINVSEAYSPLLRHQTLPIFYQIERSLSTKKPIKRVFCRNNGRIVLDQGKPNGKLPGKVLKLKGS